MNATDMKKWIDEASYESLLHRWRFAPSGDPYFQGEVGEHYTEKMKEKRAAVSDADAVMASKRMGW